MLDKNYVDTSGSTGKKINPSEALSRGSGAENCEKEHLIVEDADRESKVKNSERDRTSSTGAVSFVDKTKYGVADPDEVDDALAGLIVDKTPTTQRRII